MSNNNHHPTGGASHHLHGRTILLIISGGIAAYKSLALARCLRKSGARVIGVITRGGLEFITPLSLSALTEERVYTDLFSLTDEQEMGHIRLARLADAVMVAPASANFIARAALGQADDLASTILLATQAPIFICPAMNPTMFAHPETAAHITALRARGIAVVEPAVGDTACGEVGKGRLPEAEELLALLDNHFATPGPLQHQRWVVTTGPTRERLDRVRYLTNFSSGKQGVAVAQTLARAGATVSLVRGPMDMNSTLNDGSTLAGALGGIKVIAVETATEMLTAVLAELNGATGKGSAINKDTVKEMGKATAKDGIMTKVMGFVGAAAVSDFRPSNPTRGKLSKAQLLQDGVQDLTLPLTLNPDILATVGHMTATRPKWVVGFAAEADNSEQQILAKKKKKQCDLLLMNLIDQDGRIFGSADTNIVFYDRANRADDWGQLSKELAAKKLIQYIIDNQ